MTVTSSRTVGHSYVAQLKCVLTSLDALQQLPRLQYELACALQSLLFCTGRVQARFDYPRCARSRRAAMHPTTLAVHRRQPAGVARVTTSSSSCFNGTRERWFTDHRHCRPSVSRTRGGRRSLAPRVAGVVADDRLGAGKTPLGAPGLGRHATKSCNILKATDHCFSAV